MKGGEGGQCRRGGEDSVRGGGIRGGKDSVKGGEGWRV